MPSPMSFAQFALGQFQCVNDEAGPLADGNALPVAIIGISARPVGSSRLMIHETAAAREAASGPKRRSPPCKGKVAIGGIADATDVYPNLRF